MQASEAVQGKGDAFVPDPSALPQGCRGFNGPVPLPLWMRLYSILVQCTSGILLRQSLCPQHQKTAGRS